MTVNIKEEAMNLRVSGKGTQEKLDGVKERWTRCKHGIHARHLQALKMKRN